jgi:hypothetical protein
LGVGHVCQFELSVLLKNWEMNHERTLDDFCWFSSSQLVSFCVCSSVRMTSIFECLSLWKWLVKQWFLSANTTERWLHCHATNRSRSAYWPNQRRWSWWVHSRPLQRLYLTKLWSLIDIFFRNKCWNRRSSRT